MPKATATVNGHTVAETDSYEFIEGNVYVRPPLPFHNPYSLREFSFPPPPSTRLSSPLHPQQQSAPTRVQHPTTRSQRTRPRPKTPHGSMRIQRRSLRRSRALWPFIRVNPGLRFRVSEAWEADVVSSRVACCGLRSQPGMFCPDCASCIHRISIQSVA